MIIADAPSHGLQNLAIQLGEVNIEQRGFDVELNSKGPIAQQKVKGHFVEKIGAGINFPDSGQGDWEKNDLQDPRQRQDSQSLSRLALLRLTGNLCGFKEAVRHHQNRDQRQEEDGVGGVSLAEPRRHFISRRFEDQPADHSKYHAEEDNGGSVVRDYAVDIAGPPGKARHHKILGDADNQHREGTHRQENESGKNKNM